MMMTNGGIYWMFTWLMIIIATTVYYFIPIHYLGKKYEYVKFFLVFFSVYFLVMYITEMLLATVACDEVIKFIFAVFLIPALFLSHWLYRFRTIKKSRHLSFFLFFATICLFGNIILMFLTRGDM